MTDVQGRLIVHEPLKSIWFGTRCAVCGEAVNGHASEEPPEGPCKPCNCGHRYDQHEMGGGGCDAYECPCWCFTTEPDRDAERLLGALQ